MTAPVYLAVAPEVHSALLNAGPGPGPLLAAAAAWSSLSSEYTSTAAELTAVLQTLRSGAWQGEAAERYAVTHAPLLSWLTRVGADSAAAAGAHATVAGAYTTAVATMPTLAELAANRAAHLALVGTNFFGVNTIPIALNEADYGRMWIQAAVTMATYQAVADAAVAATPRSTSAPRLLAGHRQPPAAAAENPPASGNPLQGLLDRLEPILKSLGITDSQVAHDPTVSNALTDFVADVLQNFGVNWNPAAGTLNGHVYDFYSNAAEPIWYLARTLELFENFLHAGQDPIQVLQAMQYLAAVTLFDWPTHVAQITTAVSQSPALMLALGAGIAPVGSVGGMAGLAGLAGLDAVQPAGAVPPADVAPVDSWPSATTASPAAGAAGVPTAGSASAVGAPAGAAAPGTPPPPPQIGPAGFFPPLLAPPVIGTGAATGAGAVASDSARRRAPEPDVGRTPTTAGQQARVRRRRRAPRQASGAEFMDMMETSSPTGPDQDLTGGASPPPFASDLGAGPLGSSGAARTGRRSAAAGLAAHRAADSDGTAATPLLPAAWADESAHD